VARTGGDEFSIILEEPTTREDAECVGHSLIQLLNEPFELDGYVVCVGASVGIALYPEDAASAEALCIAADRRMYSDKNSARSVGNGLTMGPPFANPFPVVQKRTSLPPASLLPH
jgi:diguanylate cyclase (GGDEF)-like protein